MLRLPAHRDVFPKVKLANDPELARNTGYLPHPYSIYHGQQLLDRAQGESFIRSVCLQGKTFIGMVGLEPGLSDEASLTCWLGRPFWGQGLGTEAAHAVVAHGFRTLGFQKITALSFDHDTAASIVLGRLGFSKNEPSQKFCAVSRCTIQATRFERVRV